jgi:hypothetical protein
VFVARLVHLILVSDGYFPKNIKFSLENRLAFITQFKNEAQKS